MVRENSQITEAIQVCHSFESDATKKREIQGLQEVMKVYNLTVGYIITIDTEETIQINNSTIYILPVWKWTLKNKII